MNHLRQNIGMKFVIFLILFPGLLFAQSPYNGQCEEDLKKFCTNKTVRSLECLGKNKNDLSKSCLQELARASQIIKSTGSRGSGGLTSFSGVMGGMGLVPPQKKIVNYSGAIAPEDNPTSIQQHRLTIASPVWSHGKENFAMSLNTGRITFDEPEFWEDENFKTPRSLSRVELGGQYSKNLNEGKLLGLRASVGSASDKVFYGMNEMTFSLNATYAYPSKTEGNYWILTAFLSNNNPLINYVPIPGFIYLKKTEKFTGMFGLPFLSLQWTPTKPLIFSTSFFITNFTAEAAYVLKDNLQLLTGFAVSQQTFLREDRKEMRDRLFFNEKKLYVGLKVPMGKMFSGDIQFGQTFDRKLAEGKRFNETDLSADFGRSWYSALNLVMMY